MANELLPTILGKLQSAQPILQSKRLAAVAIILADKASPMTLLIKRTERLGDPWSGQVAFPGGKMMKGDNSAEDTAVREAREEVGVDLTHGASFLGYYSTFRTHTGEMDVIPTVFFLKKELKVVPNKEVSGYRWTDLNVFLLPSSTSTHRLELGGASMEMPAFVVGDFVVWGLTHRIISSLLGLASA